jgi:predicted nucleic acid-binding Zn ribbon protein
VNTPDPTADLPSADGPAVGPDLARELLARARADLRRGASAVRRPTKRRRVSPQASGAGPDERDPQLLQSVVERFVADRGWQTQRAIGGVEGRWDQIVGADLAAHCRPETVTDGVLTVRAESTAWATQVRLLATTLLARLNDDLGAGTVTSLRVVGPDTPSWKRGRWSVQGRGPRDTYG